MSHRARRWQILLDTGLMFVASGIGMLVAAAFADEHSNWQRYASAGGLLLGAAGIVILSALWFGWMGEPDLLALISQAKVLSSDIFDFLGDRKRDEPSLAPGGSVDAYLAYSSETMTRYGAKFSGKALAIFDQAVEARAVDPAERTWFEHPTNALGIAHVAQVLGILGNSVAG